MSWFDGFVTRRFEVNGVNIHARVPAAERAGKPALMLLHGFPQSHVMWHRVARLLGDTYWLVLPDLRGYGDSDKPAGLPDHANYSKRTMAQDLVDVMDQLECAEFFLCGHDRGGRVAHRMALDHPEKVRKLCVIDIAPTLDMYNSTDMRFASAYYHWFHLIQPWPLPEKMIGGCARDYLHAKLGGWGSQGLGVFEAPALSEYARCFCTPEAIHGACEDYRASASIDLTHDRESRAHGLKLACDLLVLWGERGVVHKLFRPLDLWQAQCASQVSGQTMAAGHFIPEEQPEETAAALRTFLR